MTQYPIIAISSLTQLESAGKKLGKLLEGGLVVGLQGPLGAGKTTLVRAIAEGMECNCPEFVTSPTFVLMQEYSARVPIYHLDAYRLKSPEDFLRLGGMEAFDPEGVLLVEWEEKISEFLPKNRLQIRLKFSGSLGRKLEVSANGEKEANIAALWINAVQCDSSLY